MSTTLHSCKACKTAMSWAFSNLNKKLAVIVVHNIVDRVTHCHIVKGEKENEFQSRNETPSIQPSGR